MTITFFGHRNIPSNIEKITREILVHYITSYNNVKFYVGNQGSYDSMIRKLLKELKVLYPNISYSVVLAYLPTKSDNCQDYSDTIYPDGIENVPLRYAICWRNEWMIKNSDIVITFVENEFSNAAKYKKLSKTKGKTVINIADYL